MQRTALSVCPMLIPLNSQHTIYDGLVEVLGSEFRIGLDLRPHGNIRDATLMCGPELKAILKGNEDVVQKSMQKCTST